MAVLVVAVLVVAMTPRPGRDDGAATTATTSPLIVASVLSSARAGQGPDVKLATFSPIPNVVAASPTVSLDGVTIASHLPAARETVIVQTEFETYRVAWRDVQWLELDGLALVADRHLALVGYLDHGEFHSMIAD